MPGPWSIVYDRVRLDLAGGQAFTYRSSRWIGLYIQPVASNNSMQIIRYIGLTTSTQTGFVDRMKDCHNGDPT